MLYSDESKFLEVTQQFGDALVDVKLHPLSFTELEKPMIYTGERLEVPPLPQFFIHSPKSRLITSSNGFLDQICSDVIEYSRCSIFKNTHTVRSGRIWAKFSYYGENGETIKKPTWFSERYTAYRKWITKNLIPDSSHTFYIGEEAYTLYKEKGYKMMASPKVEVTFS